MCRKCTTVLVFKLQKRAVRIMTGHGNRTSCRDLFKKLDILPLKSQYIFSVLLFVVKNKKLFTTDYDSHNVKTRQGENLHLPHLRLILYQNGLYYSGIKIFSKLPSYLKELVGSPKKFKRALKNTWFFIVFISWRSFMISIFNVFLCVKLFCSYICLHEILCTFIFYFTLTCSFKIGTCYIE
jgi:hypothetical protein